MSTRAIAVLIIECSAPDEFFGGDWDDIFPEGQEAINRQGGLPCDGGGVPGVWCRKCQWGSDTYDTDIAEFHWNEFVDRKDDQP